MAIILPHGVLFRGGAEEKIRKKLLKDGNIDTIIGYRLICFSQQVFRFVFLFLLALAFTCVALINKMSGSTKPCFIASSRTRVKIDSKISVSRKRHA